MIHARAMKGPTRIAVALIIVIAVGLGLFLWVAPTDLAIVQTSDRLWVDVRAHCALRQHQAVAETTFAKPFGSANKVWIAWDSRPVVYLFIWTDFKSVFEYDGPVRIHQYGPGPALLAFDGDVAADGAILTKPLRHVRGWMFCSANGSR